MASAISHSRRDLRRSDQPFGCPATAATDRWLAACDPRWWFLKQFKPAVKHAARGCDIEGLYLQLRRSSSRQADSFAHQCHSARRAARVMGLPILGVSGSVTAPGSDMKNHADDAEWCKTLNAGLLVSSPCRSLRPFDFCPTDDERIEDPPDDELLELWTNRFAGIPKFSCLDPSHSNREVAGKFRAFIRDELPPQRATKWTQLNSDEREELLHHAAAQDDHGLPMKVVTENMRRLFRLETLSRDTLKKALQKLRSSSK